MGAAWCLGILGFGWTTAIHLACVCIWSLESRWSRSARIDRCKLELNGYAYCIGFQNHAWVHKCLV